MPAPPVLWATAAVSIVAVTSAFLALVTEPAMSARRAARHHPADAAKAAYASHPRELPLPVPGPPGPVKIPDSQIEPVDWSALDGWADDDHAAALAAFLVSCRPIVRGAAAPGEARPMVGALRQACRRALALTSRREPAARAFFEQNFRPARISRVGEDAGFLTGYYEPVVEGSRFPTRVFRVPIYRRPHDLVPPANATVGAGFPNGGQSMRRTAAGTLVPYYDRGEILDGALDGRRLELCWIKDPTEALFIQIQGSARVRLEDGTMLRINYDAHNGYPYVPVGRVLIERNIIPREQMSMQRIREWMRDNPDEAEQVRRQNRSFVFFRVVGLTDDVEALGAQGVPLTAGRSIAVDKALHVYGTPFFIEGAFSPTDDKANAGFRRLMIAQDTGSAIVGPARADIYWGAGDVPGRIAGRLRHPGRFTILIPRELDPVAAGAMMPLPPKKPPQPPSLQTASGTQASAPAQAPEATAGREDRGRHDVTKTRAKTAFAATPMPRPRPKRQQ